MRCVRYFRVRDTLRNWTLYVCQCQPIWVATSSEMNEIFIINARDRIDIIYLIKHIRIAWCPCLLVFCILTFPLHTIIRKMVTIFTVHCSSLSRSRSSSLSIPWNTLCSFSSGGISFEWLKFVCVVTCKQNAQRFDVNQTNNKNCVCDGRSVGACAHVAAKSGSYSEI